jgi:hypothetical protein
MGSHPHPEGTRRCRSRACRAPVFFARTVKGARVPLDAAPAGDDVPSQHTYWLDGEGSPTRWARARRRRTASRGT